MFQRGVIDNTPVDFKPILDMSLELSFDWWVDRLDCNVSFQRQRIDMDISDAYFLINDNNPLWGIHFRNESHLLEDGIDYWEFGGANISGEVSYYIWVKVSVEDAEKIFKKFNLTKKMY